MEPGSDQLLTVEQVAAALNTKPRFVRRLIDERRIRFTHLGRHVRIPESAVREFVSAGMVQPLAPARRVRRVA